MEKTSEPKKSVLNKRNAALAVVGGAAVTGLGVGLGIELSKNNNNLEASEARMPTAIPAF